MRYWRLIAVYFTWGTITFGTLIYQIVTGASWDTVIGLTLVAAVVGLFIGGAWLARGFFPD